MSVREAIEDVLDGRVPSAEALQSLAEAFPDADERAAQAWECSALSALTGGRLLHAVDAILALSALGNNVDALWSQLEAVVLNASGWSPQMPGQRRTARVAAEEEDLTDVTSEHLDSVLERLRASLRFGMALERCSLISDLDALSVVRVLRSVQAVQRTDGAAVLAPPSVVGAWHVSGALIDGDSPLSVSRGALVGPGRAASQIRANGVARLLGLSAQDWSSLAARKDFARAAETLQRRRRVLQALEPYVEHRDVDVDALRKALKEARGIALAPGARIEMDSLAEGQLLLASGECRLDHADGQSEKVASGQVVTRTPDAILVAIAGSEAVFVPTPVLSNAGS